MNSRVIASRKVLYISASLVIRRTFIKKIQHQLITYLQKFCECSCKDFMNIAGKRKRERRGGGSEKSLAITSE